MFLSRFLNSVFDKLESRHLVKKFFESVSYNLHDLQNLNFAKFGWQREHALVNLDKKLKNLSLPAYNETNGMFSEHLVIFSALSISNHKPMSILEIGSFDGKTARILSALFPESQITTIDLPSSSNKLKEIYEYANQFNSLQGIRAQNLMNTKNITFKELNSLNLVFENDKFDLIWVDGAHGYPTIAIDLINSLRMINTGGIVMCDDVYRFSNSNDPEYRSIGAFETLEELRKAGLIDFHLFLKRINKIYNISKFRKKYIGVFQKI